MIDDQVICNDVSAVDASALIDRVPTAVVEDVFRDCDLRRLRHQDSVAGAGDGAENVLERIGIAEALRPTAAQVCVVRDADIDLADVQIMEPGVANRLAGVATNRGLCIRGVVIALKS